MASKILLQTTIPFIEDDWHVGRFSLVKRHLQSLHDDNGLPLYEVIARDREMNGDGSDPVMLGLADSDIDQLWLFAVDAGNGLSKQDCASITAFRKRGGGLLVTRDHFDLGSSVCTLGGVGAAHYFHNINPDPDPTRHQRDDKVTKSIDYPNYHSGANGDYQKIGVETPHELLRRNHGSLIEYFPAHPHEGGVGAPPDDASAHVIATGTSLSTGRPFNLLVAFEHSPFGNGNHLGRAIAESSFHHLVDYNWDTEMGAPTFLEEPPGDGIEREPEKLNDIKQYVANAAAWLSQNRER